MEITLEKIDAIRERTGISYKEAKEILEEFNGDVINALIYLEEAQKKDKWTETVTVAGNEVVDKIKDLIKKGNITKIRVKKDNKVILDIPVTAGAIGTFLAPQIAALGTVVALISKCTLEIERPDKRTLNINDIMEEKVEQAKGFVEDLGKKVKKGNNSIDKD